MLELTPLSGLHEELVDAGWRETGRHGADLYRTRLDRPEQRLATFSWAPEYSDGWRRYAWTVLEREPPEGPTLVLLAGPEVEVELVGRLDPPVRMTVVRLQRSDQMPQPDEPVQLGELLVPDVPVVAAKLSELDNLAQAADPGAVRMLDEDTAHVSQQPTGLTVSHAAWQVQVSLDDPTASAAFSVEVAPHPYPGLFLDASSVFLVTVVRSGGVSVTYQQATQQFPLPWVGYRQRLSQADVVVLEADPGALIPLGGLLPDGARRGPAVARTNLPVPSLETAFFDLAWFLSAAAPLAGLVIGAPALAMIGTLYDLCALAYALETDRDFAGNEVSQGQLILMGVFAAAAVAGDLSAPTLTVARRVGAKLFTKAAAVAAPVVRDAVASYLRRSIGPLLADALTRMPDEDARKLFLAVEEALADLSLARVKALAALLNELLVPLLAGTKYVDNIPVPLYRAAMEVVQVAETESFRLLPAADQITALQRFRRALAAGDPGLLDLGSISRDLASEYHRMIEDQVISHVFNPQLTGFRVPSGGGIISGLELGYQSYQAGKLLKGAQARNVVEWALKLDSRTRYYALLVAQLGPDFKRVLKPIAARYRILVPDHGAHFYQDVAGLYHSYVELRALVSKAGLGAILQVDHILEQRFGKYYIHLAEYGTDEFLSHVVPTNSTVVENLREVFQRLGLGPLKVTYTHVQKTARLRELIPYGQEGKYTVQEVYNAYRRVYEHEFGLGEEFVRKTLTPIFEELLEATKSEARAAGRAARTDIRLADALRNPVLDTSSKTPQELLRTVLIARQRR
jgi:hypothetical protein